MDLILHTPTGDEITVNMRHYCHFDASTDGGTHIVFSETYSMRVIESPSIINAAIKASYIACNV